MDRPLELEIDLSYATAAIPFPVLETNEVVERVVKVISFGKSTYKIYTSANRIFEHQM